MRDGWYVVNVHIPGERGRPLIEAGLSEEDARGLDEKFGEWGPYDEREGEFVRYWSRYPELYETVLVMGESMVPER